MKRRNWVLFGILLTGFAVLFLGLQARGAFAQNMTFEEMLNSPQMGQSATIQMDSNIFVQTEAVLSEGLSNSSTQGNNPDLIPLSAEQVKQNEMIIEDIKTLIEKADREYITAGWQHSIYHEYMRSDLGMGSIVLADGTPAPSNEWTDETWSLLDKKGNILQEISLQDFGPTVPVQVGVFTAGAEDNVMQGPPEKLSTAGAFLHDAEWEKDFATFEMRDDFLGDDPVVICTITTKGTKAVEMGNRLVVGGYTEYYFSKETGLLLQMNRYDFLQDSQAQLFQQITTFLVENVDAPPAEVLKYLK